MVMFTAMIVTTMKLNDSVHQHHATHHHSLEWEVCPACAPRLLDDVRSTTRWRRCFSAARWRGDREYLRRQIVILRCTSHTYSSSLSQKSIVHYWKQQEKKQNKYITLCYSPWPGDFHATLSFELLPWAELARIVFPSFFVSVAWFFADSVSAQHYSNVFVNGRFVVCCVRTRRKVEFSVISCIFFGGCCFCVFGLLLKQCGGRATQG